MKVAILGANGQLGSDLRAAFAGVEVIPFTRSEFDVRDTAAAGAALAKQRPDVVINCTALHKLEDCEQQPDLAFAVNATAPGHLAGLASELGARFVHLSTDYVYGGFPATPLTEDVPPAPVQVYGVSKVAGEWLVQLANPEALIVRSSGLFGVAGASGKGGNFIQSVLRWARERGEMRIVNDQILSPTYTSDLAHAIRKLIEQRAAGVVHVTNSGACSWFELASWVVKTAGVTAEVYATTTAEFGAPVRRPAYSVLDNARWRALGWSPLRFWNDAVAAYLEERRQAVSTSRHQRTSKSVPPRAR